MNLLRRLVEALERQAVLMDDQLKITMAREKAAQEARELDAADAKAYVADQQESMRRVLQNQADAMAYVKAETEASAARAAAHTAKCEDWHRRILADHGIPEESGPRVQ